MGPRRLLPCVSRQGWDEADDATDTLDIAYAMSHPVAGQAEPGTSVVPCTMQAEGTLQAPNLFPVTSNYL